MANIYDIPVVGSFYAAQDRNRAMAGQELQQAGQFAQLQNLLMENRKRSQLEEMARLAGGDPNRLIEGYMQAGDAAGAAQVAQAVEVRRKLDEDAQVRRVLRERTLGVGGNAPGTQAGGALGTPQATGVAGSAPSAPAGSSGLSGRYDLIRQQTDYYQGIADALERQGLVTQSMAYRKQAVELAKLLPKFQAGRETVMTPQGPRTQLIDEAGGTRILETAPATKMHFGDTGSQIIGIDPYTGRPVTGTGAAKTMSPGERDASARGWAGNQLARERLTWDKSKPDLGQPFEATIEGRPVLAQQDRRTGQIIDPNTRKPLTNIGPKTTDTEQVSAGYAARMVNSERILRTNTGGEMATVFELAGGKVDPIAANVARNPERMRYYQAAADWVRAKLRKESGAVIGPEEMREEIRTYFPIIGDDPTVIAQKAQSRAVATRSMQQQAGAAYHRRKPSTDKSLPVAERAQGYYE